MSPANGMAKMSAPKINVQLAKVTSHQPTVGPMTNDVVRIDQATLTSDKNVTVKSSVIQRSKIARLPGWQVGDTHCHTLWSDGIPNSIGSLSSRAQEMGFTFLAISDHTQMFGAQGYLFGVIPYGGMYWKYQGDQAATINGYVSNLVATPNLAMLPTLEYSSVPRKANPNAGDPTDSHLLAFGISGDPAKMVGNPFKSSPDIQNFTGDLMIDKLQASGAVCSIAHPFNSLYPWFGQNPNPAFDNAYSKHQLLGMELMEGRLPNDIGDTFNILKADKRAIAKAQSELLAGHHLFFTSGSDAHGISLYGNYYTYVFTGRDTPDQAGILSGLRSGCTVASSGPFVLLQVGTASPGEHVTAEPGNKVTLMGTWSGHTGFFTSKPNHINAWVSWLPAGQRDISIPIRLAYSFGGIPVYTGEKTIDGPQSGGGAVYGYLEHAITAAYSSPIYVSPAGG
jgi:histidinol phosphatase-like PHP family hydrolase